MLLLTDVLTLFLIHGGLPPVENYFTPNPTANCQTGTSIFLPPFWFAQVMWECFFIHISDYAKKQSSLYTIILNELIDES